MKSAPGNMLFAVVLFSLMSLIVKSLVRIPTHELVFFRAAVSIIICLIILWKNKINIWGKNKRLLLLRGFFGTIALFLVFYTLKNLPLATAVTLQYLSPIFTILLAGWFLAQKIRLYQWICFLTCFVGVILVKGISSEVSITVVFLGILGALGSACAYTCIGLIKESEDPIVIIFYFPLVTLPLVGPYTLANWVAPTNFEWLWLIILGILVQTAQYFMTLAFTKSTASKVSMISYLGTPLAVFYGWIWFDEKLTLLNILGLVTILLAVIIATKPRKNRIPASS